ncbi:LacI family DNA-binding transcriptional regulator [Sphingobacterium thalpophilum]|uniref:LacI family DNA-binding transcriptional regulator n=1 Tax=Sphingobacterium thalpophilum TaxID=259 RepID=A0ABV4HM23_9SPHI|nr:LacI family DNA-binding transcriptional regulator [Sphingobacterium thalpophilum]
MSQLTIVDLAKKLGLSKSTVSRAFRDNVDINPATKARILAMAEEIGFSPNVYASSLKANKSLTIAIIIPEFGNKFFSQAIKGIEAVARSKGYHTLIYVTDHQVQNEASIVRSLVNGRVDGVIISASGEGKDHSHIQLLEERGIPVMFFDRTYDDWKGGYVTGNDADSAYMATKHLLENDCKRIAYLAINPAISIGKVRKDGYEKALREAGLPPDPRLILDTVNDAEQNMKDIAKLIEEEKPDAIFASVERLAISSIRVAKARRIQIPEELKIICFSCLDIADLIDPALSVVKQPAYEMGELVTKLLLEKMEDPHNDKFANSVYLDSQLIFQKSSLK